MNRREFLKKGLGGIVAGSVPLIYGCGKNSVSSELINILVARHLVADALGNNDGNTSSHESDDFLNILYLVLKPGAWVDFLMIIVIKMKYHFLRL